MFVIKNFIAVTLKSKKKQVKLILCCLTQYIIISIWNKCKKLLRYFTFFFSTKTLQNLVCILFSIQMSQISNAQEPCGARGYHWIAADLEFCCTFLIWSSYFYPRFSQFSTLQPERFLKIINQIIHSSVWKTLVATISSKKTRKEFFIMVYKTLHDLAPAFLQLYILLIFAFLISF